MKPTIILKDFPQEKTFVYLKNKYNKNLINKAIHKIGSQRLLANKIKSELNFPKIRQATISTFLNKNFLRLDLVCWLNKCTKSNLDLKKQIKQLKGETTSKPIKNIKLPLPVSKALVALLANLYCDGTSNNKNSRTTEYTNKNNTLIFNFKQNLNLVFGKVKSYQYSNKKGIINIKIPHYLGRLLYTKFRLDKHKIPSIIKNSSKKIKGAYLRAVFDDEGTIAKKYGQIRLKMKHLSYVKDVKDLLESLGIVCSKIKKEKCTNKFGKRCYYFTINGQYNIKLFLEKVGFCHPKKALRLKKAVSQIKLKNYGYNASIKVYDILKETEPKTTIQLAELLDRNGKTVNYHLNNLLKRNLVKFKKQWKKYSYEYKWFVKNDNNINMRKTISSIENSNSFSR